MGRTIHQLWIGSPFPDHLARLAATWRDLHPGWEYRLWDQDAIDTLDMPYRDLYDDAANIVPADAVNQFRSDLARWVILRDYGGLWADTDTWPLRPIDGLLENRGMVLAWEIQDRWVGVSTIYAVAGHPASDAVIEHIATTVPDARPGTRPNRLTGPKALSTVLRHRDDVHLLPEKVWYPVRWDDPLGADTGDFPDSYVVHAWGHQREINGLPAPGMEIV